jgi:hypothetical protein
LEELLEALWETEVKRDETGIPSFASQTTLQALRMTVFSTIELTDYLLGDDIGYDFVLTGKFNQDCVEVGYCYWLYQNKNPLLISYFICFFPSAFLA